MKKHRFYVCMIILLLLAPVIPASVSAQPLSQWHVRSPLPTPVPLTSVVYGGEDGDQLFVAVGNNGKMATSPDGVNWTSQNSGTANELNGVVFAGSQFVAVGAGGTILTSADGLTWFPQNSGTDAALQHVVYGKGMFVAVGFATDYTDDFELVITPVVLTSSNGTGWTVKTLDPGFVPYGAAYGNGTFAIVGASGIGPSATAAILTSEDGSNWMNRSPFASGQLYDVVYGNNQFVAAGSNGKILTSSDGTFWMSGFSGSTAALKGLYYKNGTYVAVGSSGTILTSANGITWTSRSSGTSYDLDAVGYGGSTSSRPARPELSCSPTRFIW
ncbi:WD40/YVTN/BNR-like repeat-containing protein [Cohnella caldifontis]|uniref:WD40/YVTN/BNR-like repeat-containing protein n=1 Tax=Cohnella caldifontis TaxID=3027471 RepID=UPI0023ECF998|nr:hypothetical protein [Cohnella sp. YIM B05605]